MSFFSFQNLKNILYSSTIWYLERRLQEWAKKQEAQIILHQSCPKKEGMKGIQPASASKCIAPQPSHQSCCDVPGETPKMSRQQLTSPQLQPCLTTGSALCEPLLPYATQPPFSSPLQHRFEGELTTLFAFSFLTQMTLYCLISVLVGFNGT